MGMTRMALWALLLWQWHTVKALSLKIEQSCSEKIEKI
jgi:hypothetical protein